MSELPQSASFFKALVGDGRPLIFLTALALALSGTFAWFLSATGSFLPHDVAYLGMQPEDLCRLNQCRIVHFMFHDRVAFGGVLVAIAVFYAWLALFPLANGEAWAWWILFITAVTGFASFLAYLSFGYLDSWHGWATLALLPINAGGLWTTRKLVLDWQDRNALLRPGWTPTSWKSRAGIGRLCLLMTGLGMVGAGGVILLVGMTSVFVPQDLTFLGYTSDQLHTINPRLIPLIAHDRAGFGGGLLTTGLLVFAVIWKAQPSLHLWQATLIAGGVGFACAIGVHYPIGYVDPVHLAPAWTGGALFTIGIVCARDSRKESAPTVTG